MKQQTSSMQNRERNLLQSAALVSKKSDPFLSGKDGPIGVPFIGVSENGLYNNYAPEIAVCMGKMMINQLI